jgi:hypothetical protein
MVPGEPESSAKVLEHAQRVRSKLDALAADDSATEDIRAQAQALVAELGELDLGSFSDEVKKNAETEDWKAGWHDSLAAWRDRAESLLKKVERQKARERMATDPGLTDEDRADLQRLASQLNAPDTPTPIEPLDLVESARTILQYKVRIQPTELGRLLLQVPDRTAKVSPELWDRPLEAINRRLKDLGQPTLDEIKAIALRDEVVSLVESTTWPTPQAIEETCGRLSAEGLELEPKVLALGVRDVAYRPTIWDRMDAGRQVNPEHIVNFDAGAIVLLQVLISFLMAKFHRFTTMIVGMFIAAVGIGLSAVAGGTMLGPVGGLLSVVIVGIVVFAIGEMMASPTSQEYVGRIAPRDKVATYMGYYFVAIALGNLFGGILSGEMYERLAREAQRPDLMWLVFGGLMALTAVIFILYNRFVLPKHASGSLTPSSS